MNQPYNNNNSSQVILFLSRHTAQPATSPKTNTNPSILNSKASKGMTIMVGKMEGTSTHSLNLHPPVVWTALSHVQFVLVV
jgi:hypothetical protein